jgi:SAM-dependent methyltransferase
VKDRYCIRADYTARERPEYFAISPTPEDGIVWQPDVYRDAEHLARILNARCIVDIGSGSGEKLVALALDLPKIALDVGENLDRGRDRYPDVSWREFDADRDAALPLDADEVDGALLICADVVEHLVDPARLLHAIGAVLPRAAGVVISTPDREMLYGRHHHGPPENAHHVREWSLDEFGDLLSTFGFDHGLLRHTREHSASPWLRTIEAVLVNDEPSATLVGASRRRGLRRASPAYPLAHRGKWLARLVRARVGEAIQVQRRRVSGRVRKA